MSTSVLAAENNALSQKFEANGTEGKVTIEKGKVTIVKDGKKTVYTYDVKKQTYLVEEFDSKGKKLISKTLDVNLEDVTSKGIIKPAAVVLAAPAVIIAITAIVSTVVTAPDFQNDLNFLAMDMARGDWLACAFDVIGILIPGATGLGGLSKPTRAVVDKAVGYVSSLIGRSFDEIVKIGKLRMNVFNWGGYMPLGKGSTGRVVWNNMKEYYAMQKATVESPWLGRWLSSVPMTDPRWPASAGWKKYSKNINGVKIHYVFNTKTGQVDDYKFKLLTR